MDVSQWRDAAEYPDSKAAEMRAFGDSGASRCVSLWKNLLWKVCVCGTYLWKVYLWDVLVEGVFVEYLSIL